MYDYYPRETYEIAQRLHFTLHEMCQHFHISYVSESSDFQTCSSHGASVRFPSLGGAQPQIPLLPPALPSPPPGFAPCILALLSAQQSHSQPPFLVAFFTMPRNSQPLTCFTCGAPDHRAAACPLALTFAVQYVIKRIKLALSASL